MSRKRYYVNNPANSIPGGITSSILGSSDSLSFHKSQVEYSPTPLISLDALAGKYDVGEIYIKDESRRMGLNAFKGVGALYAIDRLLTANKNIHTFCTATDGNHGRAVAWSARRSGRKACVVVPGDISEARVRAIEEEGASLVRTKGNYDEACEIASDMSKQSGWALIQDTAYEGYEEIPAHIMAGYLTIFREMEDSVNSRPMPSIDLVFLQAGVGSFAASATWYYLHRYGHNRPKLVLCEPVEADAVMHSFEMGKRSVSNGNNKTIMAGLNCNTPSLSAWEILKEGIDVSLRLDDDSAKYAMRELYYSSGSDKRILSGESGAAGLAGFLAIRKESEYMPLTDILGINNRSRILIINTEGPTDPANFKKIISTDKNCE